jgi:hypothetical protein
VEVLSPLGHPGEYAYCLAENEARSPWEPLHVERGFSPNESCVTVCGSDALHNVNDHGSTTAEALLNLARFAVIDPARFRDVAPGAMVAPFVSADDVMVIVAGGAGKHSAIIPTFGATRAVTGLVEE